MRVFLDQGIKVTETMRGILVALLACLAIASAVPAHPQRIVGGSVTTISQYPYAAALLYSWNLSTYSQSCGGAILNGQTILTAAHCLIGDTTQRWRIRLGSTYANSGGTVYNSAAFILHPQYNSWNQDNDFALIRSTSTFNLSGTARAGSISGTNYNLADNSVVYAIGWGTTSQGGSSSEQLRHVQVWTVNQATCRQRYATLGWSITDNMLCSGWLDVGGRDQCQGDSGGPLLHNGVIVGVCSWGNGCAQAYYPGVNSRVSVATSWIQNNA